MSDQRAGLTEAEIAEAIREPMTIHLLSAADIVGTIATLRADLATILAERDAAVSMGTQLERELAARTEELRLARNYMGGLLGYIENDLERVDSALELLDLSDPAALLDEAQAFVSAP